MYRLVPHVRKYGTTVTLSIVVATFAAFAAISSGFPVKHLSLNDGGIWVTDNAAGAVGRFNKPIAQLDGLLSTTSAVPDLSVVQNGAIVAAWDRNAGRLYAVDVYEPSFGAQTAASAAQIALGGTTLAVLGRDGTLRTATLGPSGAGIGAAGSAARPLASRLPARSSIAVAGDNTVFVAGGGKLRAFTPAGSGQPVTTALPFAAGDQTQVTTVGDVPVVADPAKREIYLPASRHTVTLPPADSGAGLVLQQSSPRGDVVAVATSQALYSVTLATGVLTPLSTGHRGDVAAPVQVAGCVHAAWNVGATGTYVRSCGGVPPAATTEQTFALTSPSPALVFRVNRDEVVLNDTTDGGVFLLGDRVTNAHPDWRQAHSRSNQRRARQRVANRRQRTPLIARPVTQGIRPGRTTVVHVLDKDSGPAGRPLAVTAVSRPDQPGFSVAIAPDAQAVLVTAPKILPGGDAHFRYTIDDGQGRTAQAEVTVVPRGQNQNAAPALRHGYHAPALTVASGASLSVAVIGDWRDFDGDPLYIDSADLGATAGTVSVNGNGELSYTAPRVTTATTAVVRYAVSDGIVAKPTVARLAIHVLAAASTELVPPSAEPDVAQAVVGVPVTVHPLANDLPGADPINPAARLTIAAPVASVAGATVTTDLSAGTVTFTAQRPGPFLLSYSAAFGAARTSSAVIRVQAYPAGGRPRPPVAVPDVAVIHGQQPAMVDVLANDYDPQGWILGVVGASSADPAIQVTVIGQHWLRITSDALRTGTTSIVTYTVSDGHESATGTVSVTAVGSDLSADQITARDDFVVVRAGESSAVPVLANDTSSTGLPLSLGWIAPKAVPAVAGLVASDQGSAVRVAALASVRREEETTVSYVATDASGAVATGHLHVTIEPAPSKAHPNQAPSPVNLSVRETSGDTLTIPIPTDGIDPDGDSTTVTAITAPPGLGRIVKIEPGAIVYQSYPTATGTDTFSYQVTDPYGATGTGQVSVGIMPPGAPQPPVAVSDVVNAPPGAALHIDVLANDYIAAGDHATVLPLAKTNRSLPPGTRLIGSDVYVRVPAHASDRPLDITYGVSDGTAPPSLAQVIVRAVPGTKLAPIARDDVAPALTADASAVTINVLRNDDDPTGSAADLKITAVPAGVRIHGARLTIPVTSEPRDVPYQITAPDGLTATAVVSVPGRNTSAIALKPGARITLKRHGTVTVPLGSVLTDLSGRPLRITTTDQLAASPAGDITVSAHQAGSFVVHALGGYTGPGAVTVQVYDGTSLQDKHGHIATVTIPVQVGPDVPIMRCPRSTLPVVEGGGTRTYNVSLLCHVWVDATASRSAPRYTLSWATRAQGISASLANGTSLRLSADSQAKPGTTGRLTLTPAGATAGGQVSVSVVAAPLPTAHPVTVAGARAGVPVTVDLAQVVTSPLAHPHVQVLSVSHPAGAAVTSSGSMVDIRPAASAHGTLTITAEVTDVPGRADRRISVVITVDVIGLPGPPGTPSATASSGSVVVSFAPAAANGAPVDHYTVYANQAPHSCPASPCTITGLRNGTRYDIYVVAHNSVGDGRPSAHVTALPNAVPGQVGGVATTPGDGTLGVSWNPAPDQGTPVTRYIAEISPAPATGPAIQTLSGSARSATFASLANGTRYSVQIKAVNIQGTGPWSSPVSDVPFGKPLTMAAPSATGASVPNPQVTRAITVSWPAGNGNGRTITSYTVREYSSASSGGSWAPDGQSVTTSSTSASFTVSTSGTWYSYTVSAANLAGSSPESPRSAPVQGAAPPDAPTNLSASDHPSNSVTGYNQAIHASFTVPQPNSARLTSVQYGLNAETVSGSWASPGAPGTTVDEAITGLTNGTSYVVYVRGCNDAGLCGPWAGPSNQVIPYGPPNPPSVSAKASGTSITFSWSGGGGNGRPVASYHVCFDGGSCVNTGAGSTTKSYGYSQTHTVTAYVVDTAGQQSTTASASATTVAAPMSVSLSRGPSGTYNPTCTNPSICAYVDVTVTHAAPNTTMNYYCADNVSGQFWPSSGTIDRDQNGNVVTSNGSGYVSFEAQCIWGYWTSSGHTLSVNVNGVTGSYSG